MRSLLLAFGLSCGLASSALSSTGLGQAYVTPVQKKMIEDLQIIKHAFEVGYAPFEWKVEYLGWDIDSEFEQAREEILSNPFISVNEFYKIVKTFLGSTQDQHVSVMFCSTERASLPFSVHGAEGHYFVAWIDSNYFQAGYHPLKVGDEIVKFNGRPIQVVMDELKQEIGPCTNEKTREGLAQILLTSRKGQSGMKVPCGSVDLKFVSHRTGKMKSIQLAWNYDPELIHNYTPPLMQGLAALMPKKKAQRPAPNLQTMMMNPLHQALAQGEISPYALGSERGFLPSLGEKIWEYNGNGFKGFDMQWHAYIYENFYGNQIGYIRIPHYVGGADDAEAFASIIGYLEDNTDALVIDQLNNFGGFFHFKCDLASTLTPYPLTLPKHRIKLTQSDIINALHACEFIDEILGSEEDSQSNSQNAFSALNDGDIAYLKQLKHFFASLVDQWNDGHAFTQPLYLEGTEMIMPSRYAQYTKPIVMLINEMDFSCADFLPAILQDNSRALLFGTRTAGAGGAVDAFTFPNNNGIYGVHYTTTLGERPDSSKIENLGVTPDIVYDVTVDDITNHYRDYIDAVNFSVNMLLDVDFMFGWGLE